MRVDMGKDLPARAAEYRLTGSSTFLFSLYKPGIQLYPPSALVDRCMGREALHRSLVAALRNFPLAFSRPVIRPDKTIWLQYTPEDSNNPELEFHSADISYTELAASGFAYSLMAERGLGMPSPSSALTQPYDEPLLIFKVTYLCDGGVALYSTRNHILFDGNSIFSFISYWAKCHRALLHDPQSIAGIPPIEMSLMPDGYGQHECLSKVFSMNTTMPLADISAMITRDIPPQTVSECVFKVSLDDLRQLKQQVSQSDVFEEGEWVSSNNVLAAFIGQHVIRANLAGGLYGPGNWTVFHALDMRRRFSLPPHGIGSPMHFAGYDAPLEVITEPTNLPFLAKALRKSIDQCTAAYLRKEMDGLVAAYNDMVQEGVDQPWRRLWLTPMNSNTRSVGISCMDKFPIYDADFGLGSPGMARSLNTKLNYVIVYPGPPPSGSDAHDTLYLHVTLKQPAMAALLADSEWNEFCVVVGGKQDVSLYRS